MIRPNSTRPILVSLRWTQVMNYCREHDLNIRWIVHVNPNQRDTWDRLRGLAFADSQVHILPGCTLEPELMELIKSGVRHFENA